MNAHRLPVLASAALSFAATLAAAPALDAPNVLLLMTDEHHPRVLGCSGDPLVRTPTLDELAATGVRFTAAYCQNPICVPSRVSMVSGRMASNLRTFGNTANPTYAGITTLADAFVGAGYQAAWLGKTHWGNPRFPVTSATLGNRRAAEDEGEARIGRLPQESRVAEGPVEQNPEHLVTNQALAFLEQNQGRRFFLGVSFVKPHFPFTIQQRFYDLYRGRVPPPRVTPALLTDLPAVSRDERARYQHAEATDEDVQRTRAIYYGMVTYVDEEFGRLLRRLQELGLRERTVVIYLSDHGEMLGERGIWYKNSFYESSAAVPFLWSYPPVLPRGKVITTPAMNMDVFPTLMDLCGLPMPAGLEGTSLLPVMLGTDDGRSRIALSENYRGSHTGRMIRTAQWKYFFYQNGEEYLYDLTVDPGEETNLVREPRFRAIADSLRTRAAAGWISDKTAAGGTAEKAAAGDRRAARKKKKG